MVPSLGGFVAQWMRARASEARSRGFDSLLAHDVVVPGRRIGEGTGSLSPSSGEKDRRDLRFFSLWYTRESREKKGSFFYGCSLFTIDLSPISRSCFSSHCDGFSFFIHRKGRNCLAASGLVGGMAHPDGCFPPPTWPVPWFNPVKTKSILFSLRSLLPARSFGQTETGAPDPRRREEPILLLFFSLRVVDKLYTINRKPA